MVLPTPLAKLGAQLSLLPAHLLSGLATCPLSPQWPGLAPAAGTLSAPGMRTPIPTAPCSPVMLRIKTKPMAMLETEPVTGDTRLRTGWLVEFPGLLVHRGHRADG